MPLRQSVAWMLQHSARVHQKTDLFPNDTSKHGPLQSSDFLNISVARIKKPVQTYGLSPYGIVIAALLG